MSTRRRLSPLPTLSAVVALAALALPGLGQACSVQAASSRPNGAQEMGATVICPWSQAVMPGWLSSSQFETWKRHLRTAGPRLRKHHEQLVASGYEHLTFEEFAYIDLVAMCGALHASAPPHLHPHQVQRRRAVQAAYAGIDTSVCNR